MNPEKPPTDQVQDAELSLEDTSTAHARIAVPPDAKAAYVRETDKSSGKSKQTGDLRALSEWITKHREIAELNGKPVRARTKKKT